MQNSAILMESHEFTKKWKKQLKNWKHDARSKNKNIQEKIKALEVLASCYFYGDGVEEDFEEAVGFYSIAAHLGDIKAQSNLGNCFYTGRGVKKNFEKAAFWFEMASAQGYAPAQHNLGCSFFKGEGVPQDQQEATRLFKLAAGQRFAPALSVLAWMQRSFVKGQK